MPSVIDSQEAKMLINVCKRQRLCQKSNVNVYDSRDESRKDITHKVMYHNDYMQLISSYLSIPELFASLALLSKYHTDFASHPKQMNKLKLMISYDFGEIWKTYDMNLTPKSVCQLYHDWNYFIMLGRQKNFVLSQTNDTTTMTTTANLEILMCLNKSECIKYWLNKIENNKAYKQYEFVKFYNGVSSFHIDLQHRYFDDVLHMMTGGFIWYHNVKEFEKFVLLCLDYLFKLRTFKIVWKCNFIHLLIHYLKEEIHDNTKNVIYTRKMQLNNIHKMNILFKHFGIEYVNHKCKLTTKNHHQRIGRDEIASILQTHDSHCCQRLTDWDWTIISVLSIILKVSTLQTQNFLHWTLLPTNKNINVNESTNEDMKWLFEMIQNKQHIYYQTYGKLFIEMMNIIAEIYKDGGPWGCQRSVYLYHLCKICK